ncbi:FmdE family protein [Aggregatilinea lenta]|uniref:FmdE family protein n=1 Tax=Aggregatilinea lenta TaxID=913108 RepID=UPI000E5B5AC0|nr:FmdE family protein [Aggregatilinea lenta]
MLTLEELLERSSALHNHLCPRQVLGVRMGMYAGIVLELDLPQVDEKRLFTFMETDGCGADGVSVATGCWPGRRTMRMMDYGKMAATFVDTQTCRAVRLVPHLESRQRALAYAPEDLSHWKAQLIGYRTLPDEAMFVVQPVELTVSLEAILSKHGMRVACQRCGEEIINEREVIVDGETLCRACAGDAYYRLAVGEPAHPSTAAER